MGYCNIISHILTITKGKYAILYIKKNKNLWQKRIQY